VALAYGRWTLTGAGPDGAPVNRSGRTTAVVRRQPDGRWCYRVDDPFGEACAAALRRRSLPRPPGRA
jgi:ketosteroid isomerase-like protein